MNLLTQSTALMLSLSSASEAMAPALELPEADRTNARRTSEGAPRALELEASYIADIWRNEGAADGWRYLDNLELRLNADFDHAFSWNGTTGSLSILYNNGRSLSELTGDAQVVSNVDAGVEAVRLFEAWIEREFGGEASLLVGLYDLNSEFDALSNTDLFLGSAHGIGTDISQSGENGPSIFPVTSLAARIEHNVSPQLTLRAAVLDAVPGNPEHPARTDIILKEGILAVAEADVSLNQARLLLGAWTYDQDQERVDASGTAGSSGAYVRGELCLDDRDDTCRLSIFGRLGIADGRTNAFSLFASSGLVHKPRDDISLGLAVAHASASDEAIVSRMVSSSETAVEATAAFQLSDWLMLQPNLQYVINPALVPSGRDALAIGLRVSISP